MKINVTGLKPTEPKYKVVLELSKSETADLVGILAQVWWKQFPVAYEIYDALIDPLVDAGIKQTVLKYNFAKDLMVRK